MVLGHRQIQPGQGHEAGRELLKTLYLEHFSAEMPEIFTTERGKPYFSGGNVYFSISHTKNHVFCALSERPIGIDGEEMDRDIDLRLAKKILSANEKQQYDAAADKRLALLTFWVLKEAAAKCTGEGLRGYPNKTDFSLDDPRVTTQHNCLVAVVEG